MGEKHHFKKESLAERAERKLARKGWRIIKRAEGERL